MSQDPHVETRYELTRLFSFPRLMFSRTGVFSWLLQHVVGLVTRSAELFGAKRVADSIRRRRLEAAIEYRTLCEKFFWMSVRSSEFQHLLDFGAHLGEQAIPASRYLSVTAYEPHPTAFTKLKASLTNQNESTLSVEAVNAAVSICSGSAMLNLHEQRPMSTGGSTLVTSKREFQSGSELRVLTIDVAEIMNSVLDPSRTLIKMDIEGSEYQVLRRMVSHRKFKEFGPIFVEFHERKMVGGSLERLRLTGSFWRHGLSTRRIIEWF